MRQRRPPDNGDTIGSLRAEVRRLRARLAASERARADPAGTGAGRFRDARGDAHGDALVREVHHRIKNHLQGVVALLQTHADEAGRLPAPLAAAVAQIRSVALIHGLEARGGGGGIPVTELVGGLLDLVHGPAAPRFDTDARLAEAVVLQPEAAVPTALIVAELLANAQKHAAGGPTPRIGLSGDASGVVLDVTNRLAPGASLGFARSTAPGRGLGLVEALMPPAGASLAFALEGGCVQARLHLQPPVIGTCADARDEG